MIKNGCILIWNKLLHRLTPIYTLYIVIKLSQHYRGTLRIILHWTIMILYFDDVALYKNAWGISLGLTRIWLVYINIAGLQQHKYLTNLLNVTLLFHNSFIRIVWIFPFYHRCRVLSPYVTVRFIASLKAETEPVKCYANKYALLSNSQTEIRSNE